MGRVIWINGSFGVGKTTAARTLVERLGDAFLLDPEMIGLALHDHLVPPSLYPGDFQDLPLWRSFTRDAVAGAAESYDGYVVVPMTIARADYFDETVGAVSRRVRVDHFTLTASKETILRRASGRDEPDEWARQMVDRIVPALGHPRLATHIDAETQSAQDVVDDILRRLSP
jgi:hypothetical protein